MTSINVSIVYDKFEDGKSYYNIYDEAGGELDRFWLEGDVKVPEDIAAQLWVQSLVARERPTDNSKNESNIVGSVAADVPEVTSGSES